MDTSEYLSRIDEAIRRILFMYRDMIVSYRGFGHGIDTGIGIFDAPAFVDFSPAEAEADLGIDVSLLRAGAAIALLCDLSDAWDELEGPDGDAPRLNTAREGLRDGRFAEFPEIQTAFMLGFSDDEHAFRRQLDVVYQRHVVGYLEQLLASTRL